MMEPPRSVPEDPYAFARISVMKASLLRRSDYDKLLKMSISEILRYLQEHGYRKEIDEAQSAYSGARLVEVAVARGNEAALAKLRRITNPALASLIELYARRFDAHNMKVVLRAVQSGEAASIEELFFPIGTVPKKDLLEIARAKSVTEAVGEFKKRHLMPLSAPTTLAELEDFLTRSYYEEAIAFAERLPSEAGAFKTFLINEVRVLNIITLFKLRSAGFDDEAIRKQLILRSDLPLISALLREKRVEDMFARLSGTYFAKAAEEGAQNYAKDKSLVPFETALWRRLLAQNLSLMHSNPLSIDIILGFMFAKGIEARNLRLLAKAKETGLPASFVEGELII